MDFVLTHILEVVAPIAAAIGFLFLLRLVWQPSKRRTQNDTIGPSVGVIGTTYAVILAFMLSGVWSTFQAAQTTAEQEANCLVNVFRFAQGLPADERDRVQHMARDYVDVMINDEWKAMEHEGTSQEGWKITQDLWLVLSNTQPHNASERTALDHTLSELTAMTERRRIRLLQSRTKLPIILWAVLIMGGLVTVMSVCLFGVEDFKFHVVQVSAIAFLISLVLVAIADIDRPYHGSVRVGDDGFRYARETLQRWPESK